MPRIITNRGSSGGSSVYGQGLENGQAEAVFSSYIQAVEGTGGKDSYFSQGLARVQEFLDGSAGDSSSCLICLSAISPTDAVWSCQGSCFALYHLNCAQEWARNQVDAAVLKAMNRLSNFPNAAADARASATWGCPKCRHPYPAKDGIPRTYLCFCGKVENPEFDPWRAAHSCGEMCGRSLAGDEDSPCRHTCLLLCHPGPCPPCPLLIDAPCFCGHKVEKRRCGRHHWSCGGICSARLECGHTCKNTCHEGECPPCPVLSSYKCLCGSEARQLQCHERQWQCGRVCGKPLSCGKHRCDKVCHAGPCGGCPHEGTRTCPCGKEVYPDLSCTEAPTPCGATCGKLLPCGLHRCQERCHTGECSKCRALVNKSCRCGKMQKEVICSTELVCERRCTNMRACGRHPCKRRCCDGETCPDCTEVCNRKLRCGNHRCPAPCHSGPCRPCPLTVSFTCACGGATVTLPCGAEARAVAPRCHRACPVPGLCRHAAAGMIHPHRCHYGPCPPCTLPCGTPLPCGHACSSEACHDPAPPPVAEFRPPPAPKAQLLLSEADELAAAAATESRRSAKRNAKQQAAEGPSSDLYPAQQAAAQARALLKEQQQQSAAAGGGAGSTGVRSPCPACPVLMSVQCLGEHEARSIPCSKSAPFSCERPCGQALACGNHTCELRCHATSGSSSTPCHQCTRSCGRKRPTCSHPCPLQCHTGPCPACGVDTRVPCHCGKATLALPCSALTEPGSSTATPSSGKQEAGDKLSCGKPCHRPLPNCPHPCRVPCHPGACPGAETCSEEVVVRCQCKRQRAKWSCAAVQQKLLEQRGSRVYDATAAPRLLPCTEECTAAAAAAGSSKGDRGSDSGLAGSGAHSSTIAAPAAASARAQAGPGLAERVTALLSSLLPKKGQQGGQQGAGATPASALAVEGQKKSSRQMTRAERQALAEQREAERARAEKMQRFKSSTLPLIVMVAVGLLLAVVVPRVLSWVDAILRG